MNGTVPLYLKNALSIGIFGLLGVFSRYYISLFINKFFPSSFPSAVFLINLLGCFLIGLVFSIGMQKSVFSFEIKLGIIVGFLGGFTTFSSYSLENFLLIEKGNYLYAFYFCVLQPLIGLILTWIGVFLGRRFF